MLPFTNAQGKPNIWRGSAGGPGNTVSGAQYPVEALAGLLPGSRVPPGANTFDAIHVALSDLTPRGRLYWADLSSPYVLDNVPISGVASGLQRKKCLAAFVSW